MRQKLVMGNWKMNGRKTEVTELLHTLLEYFPLSENARCVVFPPAAYLSIVEDILKDSKIHWGAQNIYPKDSGAFTGEVSGPMVKDFNCSYVLVGHSERRHLFKESENFVAEKFHHVKDHGMIPVLCVGETLEERENGLTEKVLSEQLLAINQNRSRSFQNCIVAYEPVWAIGTGKTATPEQAQEVHAFIRNLIAKLDQDSASTMPIVYGGSVNEKNAASLFAMSDIDGGLVGGASLNARQFLEIVKCIN